MTTQDFRTLALGFAGAVESEHMLHPDFRHRGKVFATLGYPSEGWGMVKLKPAQQRVYLRQAPGVFRAASGAWGKSGSTIVYLESAKKALVKAALAVAIGNLSNPKEAT